MTTLVKASCHCGRNVFQVAFKTSTLPKSAEMCHCNICRHCTGNMAVIDPGIVGEPYTVDSTEDNLVPADLSNLKPYTSSSVLKRYFCGTCSAHMFFCMNNKDYGSTPYWTVMWGVLEKIDGILEIKAHMWLSDTLDGGIANHLIGPSRHGEWVKKDEESLPLNWRASGEGYKNPDTLPLFCHCRKCSFYLTRALKPSENPAEYWLVPGKEATDPIRFITAHCLCNSCRQTSGGQIQTWTIVPTENVFDASTNAPIDLIDPKKRPQHLHQYVSSDGKHRESCDTCGASVFWWRKMKEGETPHMDVATALIDEVAAGGARAESWLSWYPRVIFPEFALSKATAEMLMEGVKCVDA